MALLSHPIVVSIIENLIVELLLIIIGVLLAHTIIRLWNEWRYGGWHVTVIKDNETKICDRKISFSKIKQIRDMPEEKTVFLKGICSPFHYIQEDIMNEGSKVLVEDEKQRRFIINLDQDIKKPSTKKTLEKSPAIIFIQSKFMEGEKEHPGLISFDESSGRIIIELVDQQQEIKIQKGL